MVKLLNQLDFDYMYMALCKSDNELFYQVVLTLVMFNYFEWLQRL